MHYNLSSWRSCRSVSLLRKLKFPNFTIFICKFLQVSSILAWSPIVVVQSLSLVWLFVNAWTAACQASMSLTISQSLLKFMSIELVMLSNHFNLCYPLSFCLQSFLESVFSNESALHIRCPKYWSFRINPSNGYSGLISFRVEWFDLLAVQGTLKSLL